MNLDKDIFSDIRVLIIGDSMIDQYMHGKSDRKSPEADIPILEKVTLKSELGGAANVANNIVLLGAKAILLTVVGEDKEAGTMKTKLIEHSIHHELVVDRERCTTVKTRLFDGDKPLLRIDREETNDIDQRINKNLLSRYYNILDDTKIDLIILQDYNKGVLTKGNISLIIEEAKNRDILVSVDPKVNNFNEYKNVDLFKPNLKELLNQYNKENYSVSDLNIIADLAKKKALEIASTTFLLTLSEQGAMIFENGGSKYMKAIPIDVVDVCGAGDAVIAVCSLAKVKQLDLETILALSIKTGEIVCKKTGVSGICVKELNN